MSWDLAIDRETGDLMFGPYRDLMGVTGTPLNDQRIIVRCKIPRGSFSYDEIGTLGSRLHEIAGTPIERQLREAPALAQEAVEEMDDINVIGVQAEADEKGRVLVEISYNAVVRSEEGDEITQAPPVQFATTVTI